MDPFQMFESEFDLSLLDQTTNVKPTTSLKLDRGVRKLAVVRLKEKIKEVSTLVSKANYYQELYLEEQKCRIKSSISQKQVDIQLQNKNKECDILCTENSKYVNQLAEQTEEIKQLKEKQSNIEKLEYDIKMKDQSMTAYIDQMEALKFLYEKEMKEKKKTLNKASLDLKKAKASVGIVEKKLVRVLKEYIIPTKKKRDRWLESIIKNYCNETIEKEEEEELEESNKVKKSVETDKKRDETGLCDEVLIHTSDTQPILHRNISSDFDNIGSVDTGRGSSLGLSEEEKSLSSPEYFLGFSPHSDVTNTVCNKCNKPQSDGSTSPIFPERSDFADNCKRCDLISKKDACTSPIPSQRLDTATNTCDDIFDTSSLRKEATSNVEQTHINIDKISQITHTADKKECEPGCSEISPKDTGVSNKELFASSKEIQDFTVDSDEHDDLVDIGSGLASPVAELNKLSPINFDKVRINSQIVFIEEAPTAAAKSQDDKIFDVNDSSNNLENVRNESYVGESSITSQCGIEAISTIQSEKEALTTSVKVHGDTGSNTDNNVVVQDVSLITKSHMFSSTHFDDTVSTTPTTLQNKTPDLNINRSAQQQLERLELNNNSDVADDTEIRIIFDKMRLSHELITPIPRTPPRSKTRSPEIPAESLNTINDRLINGSTGLDDILHNMERNIQESQFSYFKELLANVQQIQQLQMQQLRFNSDANKVLPNSYCSSNRRNENLSFHENEHKLSSYNAHAESICRRRPDMVDLNMGSMLHITEMNENEDSTYNDSIIIEDQITSTENNNTPDNLACTSNKEIHNEMSNAHLIEVDQSHEEIACLNSKVTAENSFNSNNTEQTAHEVTHDLSENNVECDNNTQVSVVNSNTASSLSPIESRKSIDSDNENDLPISELFNLTPNNNENLTPRKRNRKPKKKSKLNALRIKMLPKSKIKKDDIKSLGTQKSKLIHANVPKKKVTISDTAATLNDKAVYENAVRVFTQTRLAKVPKIILEDCNSQDQSKNIAKNKDDISSKPQSTKPQSSTIESPVAKKNNKRKWSVMCTYVPDNISANISETKKGKRTGTLLDENSSDKSPKKIKQKANDILHQNQSLDTADAKMLSPKHAQEAVHTSDSSDTKVPKRKRSSVSDCPTQNHNSRPNVNIEPHSSRVLRSLTIKNKEASICKETPIIVQTRQRLQSKENKNEPETCGDTSLSKRISRITRQKSHSGSENTPVDLFSSPRSKSDQKEPQPCGDTYNTSSKPKTRISRIKTPSGSENTQVALHSSPPSDTSLNNSDHKTSAVSYADLNMFSDEEDQQQIRTSHQYSKYSLLCQTIQKYGVKRIKFIAKQAKEPEVNKVCKKLEKSLSEILEVPHELRLSAMKKLVAEIQTWNKNHFLLGFIKFLKAPERKQELFSKLLCPPYPPMTKKEQILLFVLDELQKSFDYRDIVKKILLNIEYTLLALNKTAETFDVIETMSHFYAVLCRGYQKISQLRMFIIDAMYCLQKKSINLIQQCLDVWTNVLPMGHTGHAKCPLVVCLVYLLHFYKCEDRFNNVQNIRNMLRYKYSYDLTEWNENMILDMFRTAIVEIKDSAMERKILRLSLLILSKRHGAKWCHTNIVKGMLLPIISDQSTTGTAKQFCASMVGPLMKPYPGHMKVQYEMTIDYLMEMLERKNTPKMQEAIVSSLIYVDKKNQRLHQFLAKWSPKEVSPEFALVFRDYVRSKPVHVWKKILSWKM